MTTVPVPPPPPPPPAPSQPPKQLIPLSPQLAAIPFCHGEDHPVQETTPSAEALHDTQDEPAPPQPTVHNGPPPPPQEQDDPDNEGKKKPVQETDPAPQTLSSSQNFGIAQTTVQEDNATNLDQTEEK
ncbi:leucine-rich repeat extensin-like protein 3 isoform X2 [Sphaeramia orbicularis]|uniref:leucine-rich repeat extensin-like protein 3 isoform X2 n=1 Tax=Sphaeramia orbicularis TaxID=375764 RepID=UPI00117CF0C4|nr:leucine-rich repeat extensin-like protein 3 isoform X2 [Sphaeramia orbicularis]